jgi:hypothetical protein
MKIALTGIAVALAAAATALASSLPSGTYTTTRLCLMQRAARSMPYAP